PAASAPKTIDFSEGEKQWENVSPNYINPKGSTPIRNYPGFGSVYYKNTTGKNDIINAKVARDNDYIYFFAKCSNVIVDKDNDNCMVLFIDTDRSKKTGWEGYDYRIAGKELQKCTGGFNWEKAASVKKSIEGDFVQIAIKKSDLNLGESFDIEFKWSDNMQEADAMDFYVNGCCAPIGRFNYRYKV
ncbi:MAG: hypothetical protein Q8873_08480, partial [Bacillota bacterium]|nr:hypothetical protein [Bacillota bacterium]